MVDVIVLYAASIVMGVLSTVFGFYSLNYAIRENKSALKYYAFAILLMSIGFIIHTSGDYFGGNYADKNLELGLESFAHVILFIAFTVFAVSAKKTLNLAREFKFR